MAPARNTNRVVRELRNSNRRKANEFDREPTQRDTPKINYENNNIRKFVTKSLRVMQLERLTNEDFNKTNMYKEEQKIIGRQVGLGVKSNRKGKVKYSTTPRRYIKTKPKRIKNSAEGRNASHSRSKRNADEYNSTFRHQSKSHLRHPFYHSC